MVPDGGDPDPDLARLLSRLHGALASAAEADPAAQDAHLSTALELLESLPDRSAPDTRRMAAMAENLARSRAHAGRPSEGEALLRRSVGLLEDLAAREPADRVTVRQLVDARSHLANAIAARDPDQAERLHRDAIAFWIAESRDFPAVPSFRRNVAIEQFNLSFLLRRLDRTGEALELLEQAAAALDELAERHPEDWGLRLLLFTTLFELGVNLEKAGELEAARDALRRGTDTMDEVTRRQPDVMSYRVHLAGTLHSLARIEQDLGDVAGAGATWERAASLQRQVLERHPDDHGARDGLRHHCWALAEHYVAQGDPVRAARAADELAGLFSAEREGREAAEMSALAAGFLAQCAPLAAGDPERAAAYDRRALELLRSAIHHGFRDLDSIRGSEAFLRFAGRPEFEALLAEVTPGD
jgi:tetratricopeptide (TPR) repeat protein